MKKTLLSIAFTLLVTFTFAQEVLYSGSFESDSYFTTFEGDWKIIQKDEAQILIFEENFEAKKAPDLKVFLTKITFEDVSGKNASDPQKSVLISQLNKYKGKMEFQIPAGIKLSDYSSLIVHCEKYSKLWGGSELE